MVILSTNVEDLHPLPRPSAFKKFGQPSFSPSRWAGGGSVVDQGDSSFVNYQTGQPNKCQLTKNASWLALFIFFRWKVQALSHLTSILDHNYLIIHAWDSTVRSYPTLDVVFVQWLGYLTCCRDASRQGHHQQGLTCGSGFRCARAAFGHQDATWCSHAADWSAHVWWFIWWPWRSLRLVPGLNFNSLLKHA